MSTVATSRNGRRRTSEPPRGAKRVAIYTRQSVDRSSEMEFGSLDSQRDAIESYVKSQAHDGWVALPEVYADGGFSGATTERPAFKRLMEDVKAGRVDVIAVYKIDRLSRSLLDFAGIIRVFEEHGVEFVSITQQFSTGSSMGKLTLNILMSFAEFEREVISERTRDKIAASRRKGLWVGGHPPLGYRSERAKLIVVPEEAELVGEIFDLYLKLGTLSEVCAELQRRGLKTKRGATWSKSQLSVFLKQILYIGKVPYRDEVHQGQHEAILEESVFLAAQEQLKRHRRAGGADAKNKWSLLLRGLLFCARCGKPMGHTYSGKKPRLHHYYLCPSLAVPAKDRCDGCRIPAREIEDFVIAKIREIGRDPTVVTATLEAARVESERMLPGLVAELRRHQSELRRRDVDRRGLLDALPGAGKAAGIVAGQIAEVDERLQHLRERIGEVQGEIIAIENGAVDEHEIRLALADFDPVWAELLPRERQRVLALVIDEIRYDPASGDVEIHYRSGGIKALAARRTA